MVVFLALMNLKFQPQRNIESPFETQGVVMAMFVICMLVYSITFCTPYFVEVIDDINLLAGSLATVLLSCNNHNQSTNMAVPFETHPAIMFIFITVILVYAATAAIKTSNANSSIHRIIVSKISLLSGSLATVVLLLVFVPPIGWFILVIWTFFLVKQIYDGMLHLPCLIISALNYVIYQIWGRLRDLNQGRNRLPI
ncbi:hypothetical protein Gogos_019884 [Gossypium gossypioides]|uniref:Uncharacterized protein n=1 Tax=Gossypium gossypioides TaxID=34282 RepID=A0A7J9D3X3_GOSGO|nr:hypothetical protein [Gossypium gossypioides]